MKNIKMIFDKQAYGTGIMTLCIEPTLAMLHPVSQFLVQVSATLYFWYSFLVTGLNSKSPRPKILGSCNACGRLEWSFWFPVLAWPNVDYHRYLRVQTSSWRFFYFCFSAFQRNTFFKIGTCSLFTQVTSYLIFQITSHTTYPYVHVVKIQFWLEFKF